MEGPAWASTNDYAAPLTSHKAPGVLTPIHSHGGQYTVIMIMIMMISLRSLLAPVSELCGLAPGPPGLGVQADLLHRPRPPKRLGRC